MVRLISWNFLGSIVNVKFPFAVSDIPFSVPDVPFSVPDARGTFGSCGTILLETSSFDSTTWGVAMGDSTDGSADSCDSETGGVTTGSWVSAIGGVARGSWVSNADLQLDILSRYGSSA